MRQGPDGRILWKEHPALQLHLYIIQIVKIKLGEYSILFKWVQDIPI